MDKPKTTTTCTICKEKKDIQTGMSMCNYCYDYRVLKT